MAERSAVRTNSFINRSIAFSVLGQSNWGPLDDRSAEALQCRNDGTSNEHGRHGN